MKERIFGALTFQINVMHNEKIMTDAFSFGASYEMTGGEETLGQIAARDLRKVEIFKKYGLDFCCGGKQTVKEACEKKGLDLQKIEAELMMVSSNPVTRPLPYNEWTPEFLCDFIVNTHHRYVSKTLPDLLGYAKKVSRVHGEHHPELLRIYQLVQEINEEMTTHMMKEEKILFPFIKKLFSTTQNHQPLQAAPFGTVQNPVAMMESEHEDVGGKMAEIRLLTSNYALPEGACGSYSVLYRLLLEFEEDLHIHVHLENNILFPRAIALEKEIFSAH
jgi:regulator of cell morphogenesis and NO signaling